MSRVGTVYGLALYGLAQEEALEEPIARELEVLSQAFAQEPDFLALLCAPGLDKQTRCGILEESFRGKVQPYVLNFLKLLTERGLARHFPECAAAYREQYHRDRGILPVTAVTAVPLSPSQSARLEEKLAALTGKTVVLTNRVDPEQLGGVRLDYDGKRVEDTVARRLADVGARLHDPLL